MLGLETIILFTALSAPAEAGPGQAATNELSIELDTRTMQDDGWDSVTGHGTINTIGFSAGYGLSRNLTLLVGVHHRTYRTQTEYYVYDEDYDYTYREMETSFSATRLSIGPKYSLRVTDWLRPYAVAHATAMVGILGADEDSGDDDNLNEMTWRSISPGIDAGIGLDVIPVRGDQIHIATHLELGYGAALDMNFSDSNGTIAGSDENVSVGSLAIQGVQIKWGVGVHF